MYVVLYGLISSCKTCQNVKVKTDRVFILFYKQKLFPAGRTCLTFCFYRLKKHLIWLWTMYMHTMRWWWSIRACIKRRQTICSQIRLKSISSSTKQFSKHWSEEKSSSFCQNCTNVLSDRTYIYDSHKKFFTPNIFVCGSIFFGLNNSIQCFSFSNEKMSLSLGDVNGFPLTTCPDADSQQSLIQRSSYWRSFLIQPHVLLNIR